MLKWRGCIVLVCGDLGCIDLLTLVFKFELLPRELGSKGEACFEDRLSHESACRNL